MNPPKVYLFDLKEHQIPVLYFEDGKVTGLRCPVCKGQHDHALIPTSTPGISSIAPLGHATPINFDYAIARKEYNAIVNVAREQWLAECTKQVEATVGALWQGDFEDCNIFVFRKFLKDGTCDIGVIGRKGTAKRKTHRKLQAISDNFLHRLGNLKAFW